MLFRFADYAWFGAIAGLTLTVTQVQSGQFSPNDVRAIGMGGAGVAVAKAASAGLFNPAMLSAQKKGDDFQFAAGLGAVLADNGELHSKANHVDDDVTELDRATTRADDERQILNTDLNRFQNNPTVANRNRVQADLNIMSARLNTLASGVHNVDKDLNDFSGNRVQFDFGMTAGAGGAGKTIGIGIFHTLNVYAAFGIDIDPLDSAFINDVGTRITTASDAVSDLAAPGCLEDTACRDAARARIDQSKIGDYPGASSGTATGAGVFESGVALSHQFTIGDSYLSVGLTPKNVLVKVAGAHGTVHESQVGTLDDSANTDLFSFNAYDIGAVYQIGTTPWQIGLVAKNLAGKTITKKLGTAPNTIEQEFNFSTQWRAGLARVVDRYTLTADLDLKANQGVVSNDKTQFLSLGGEYDLGWFQFRGGYRRNLANSSVDDVLTYGFGIGPVDFAAVKSSQELGYYFRLNFGW